MNEMLAEMKSKQLSKNPEHPRHFKGKDALGHVIEAQAAGIAATAEVHGTEIPGPLSAACDAARETALILSFFWVLQTQYLSMTPKIVGLAAISFGWTLWKAGRSAWLGWFRLERLHRVLEQERWEIENHRQQERDELRVLYAAKGFEGKLLEDVLDVLMADNDRLLKIMIEEELGLSLETYEHPLKQGLGAACGVIVASLATIGFYILYPPLGILVGGALALGIAAAISAHWASNKIIPAIVWNLGLALLAIGGVYYFIELIK